MNWYSVRQNCDDTLDFLRRLIQWMVEFLTDDTMYSKLNETVTGNAIFTSIKSTAITLCVLFFLIDFFQKSLHLQWVTWENVILFFMKLIMAKLIINNAGSIMAMIQKGFASIISGAGLRPRDIATQVLPAHGSDASYFFESGSTVYEKIATAGSPTMFDSFDLNAGFFNIWVTIIGLIMRVVFIIAAIMIIARVFELFVYTMIAPIPLATFSCEGLQDVGKGFLKSYAAVCLQAVVMVVMFIVYGKVFGSGADLLNIDNINQSGRTLLFTFIFGAGIMQSGSWAKKFCGAM